ncbi:unnamed protein product [Orchesella dallaii]|uniref:Uncharacterized protein n=1 Tax=Orchesella dallaii TaxID=48710 RepID=A0ABP1S1F1_9HEXA
MIEELQIQGLCMRDEYNSSGYGWMYLLGLPTFNITLYLKPQRQRSTDLVKAFTVVEAVELSQYINIADLYNMVEYQQLTVLCCNMSGYPVWQFECVCSAKGYSVK